MKRNRLHERRLRALLTYDTSIFKHTLSQKNNTTIHVKNIQKLMVKLYKYHDAFLGPIMNGTFTKMFVKYNFPICRVTLSANLKTIKYSTDWVVYENCQNKVFKQQGIKLFLR